jgi:hypothetical protein
LAPFLLGYIGTPVVLWTSLIIGALIAFLGFKRSYKWDAGAGVITIIAPWVLGFSSIHPALGMCLAAGIVVTILAGYLGFSIIKKH